MIHTDHHATFVKDGTDVGGNQPHGHVSVGGNLDAVKAHSAESTKTATYHALCDRVLLRRPALECTIKEEEPGHWEALLMAPQGTEDDGLLVRVQVAKEGASHSVRIDLLGTSAAVYQETKGVTVEGNFLLSEPRGKLLGWEDEIVERMDERTQRSAKA